MSKLKQKFSKPKFLRKSEKKEVTGYGTIEALETKGFGHSLITNQRKEKQAGYGMMTEKESKSSVGHANQLIKHAKTLLNTPLETSFQLVKDKGLHGVRVIGKEPLMYFESEGIVQGIRGYAGSINTGVFVKENGTIHSIHHIGSKETRSYLEKIRRKGYYEQYEHLPLSGNQKIDAVSGATLTSEAIAHTSTALLEKATTGPLINFTQIDEINAFSVTAILSSWWILHISLIFLLFLYGFQKKFRKSKRGVILLSLFSVIYIGFFLNNSFTYLSFIHPFVGTNVSSLVGLYALFTLLGAIWGKNTYCKYVCPFGNVQRLLLQVTPKSATVKFFLPNKWIRRVRSAITVGLIVGVLVGLRGWSNFELFPDLFGPDFRSWWFFTALISVLITLRYPLIWCRLLCPTGSVLDFISDAVNNRKK